jgi:hypothetical protein
MRGGQSPAPPMPTTQSVQPWNVGPWPIGANVHRAAPAACLRPA